MSPKRPQKEPPKKPKTGIDVGGLLGSFLGPFARLLLLFLLLSHVVFGVLDVGVFVFCLLLLVWLLFSLVVGSAFLLLGVPEISRTTHEPPGTKEGSAAGAQPLDFLCFGRRVSCAGLLLLFVRFLASVPFSFRCFLDLTDKRANASYTI